MAGNSETKDLGNISSQFRAKICHKTMKNIWQKNGKTSARRRDSYDAIKKSHFSKKFNSVFAFVRTTWLIVKQFLLKVFYSLKITFIKNILIRRLSAARPSNINTAICNLQ